MRKRLTRLIRCCRGLAVVAVRRCREKRHTLIGLGLLIGPAIGVIWVAGLPGSKTPTFVNLAIDAGCNTKLDPVLHVHIPDDSERARDLVDNRSQARIAIQLVDTLASRGTLDCSYVRLNSSAPLRSPLALMSQGNDTVPPLWFYIDPTHSFSSVPLDIDHASERGGLQMSVASEHLESFAGALLFELGEGMEQTSQSTSTLSVSLLLRESAAPDGATAAGASLTLPPDYRLIQDLSIPAAVNVLASNRGPRYEFDLQESHLGNAANAGHWVSFHAVMEDTVWAKWQEYLLFLFSGLFGFGVGFLFESVLASRRAE